MLQPKGTSVVPRRVVTGVVGGRSAVLSDGPVATAHFYENWPGFMTSVLWATAPVPTVPPDPDQEPVLPGLLVTPPPGETRLLVVRFPPDSVFADPRFNPEGLAQEQSLHMRGLAEAFEPDAPGMHTTETLDYDFVLDGEIWLELDDGHVTHLRQGDVVVQGGGRHAWRNLSERTATMAFVLIGAVRSA